MEDVLYGAFAIWPPFFDYLTAILIPISFRQMNMDYAICHALNYQSHGLPEACVIYDISCQWCRWFLWRVLQSPHLSVPLKMNIYYAVGKFHLGGHDVKCFPKFTLNFMEGSGQAVGEILETLWSPLKLIVRSSRSMSSAHRMEFLDHQMRDSNFLKMVHMGASDVRHYLTVLMFTICCGCSSLSPSTEGIGVEKSRTSKNRLPVFDVKSH